MEARHTLFLCGVHGEYMRHAIRPRITRDADPAFTRALFIVALTGAILNFITFYPGILHHDAWAYFDAAQRRYFNNWQPPLLGYLWIPLQAIYYGPQPMLVLFTRRVLERIFTVRAHLRRGKPRARGLELLPPRFSRWRSISPGFS